jgi:hypothetical protein
MGQLGDMFPGAKVQDSGDEDSNGERFQPGPLDLDSGVVRLRPQPAKPAEPKEESSS